MIEAEGRLLDGLPRAGLAANQLAPVDEADIGDQHLAVHIVTVAAVAGIEADPDGQSAAKASADDSHRRDSRRNSRA